MLAQLVVPNWHGSAQPALRCLVMSGYQLAEVNIALAREPLDAPLLAEFMAALDLVNARADQASGFVWRMQSEDGDATAVRGFGGDPRLIINLTVSPIGQRSLECGVSARCASQVSMGGIDVGPGPIGAGLV